MARVNFNEVDMSERENNYSKVGFFGLKNNNDEAIVRIMHDDVNSFDIVSVHDVAIEGSRFGRHVNCLREAHDSLEKCPFCANNVPLKSRLFIHLVEYVRDDNGKIIGKPKIWERSLKYATELSNLIADYGPLSDNIFKIRRSGAPGDMATTYSINYAPPTVYKSEFYPKDTEAFSDFSVIGSMVLDKTAQEMQSYISTGVFPQKQKMSDVAPVEYSQPVTNNYKSISENEMFSTNVSSPVQFAPGQTTVTTAPWENSAQNNIPKRYY